MSSQLTVPFEFCWLTRSCAVGGWKLGLAYGSTSTSSMYTYSCLVHKRFSRCRACNGIGIYEVTHSAALQPYSLGPGMYPSRLHRLTLFEAQQYAGPTIAQVSITDHHTAWFHPVKGRCGSCLSTFNISCIEISVSVTKAFPALLL